jgi:hypothetical protein
MLDNKQVSKEKVTKIAITISVFQCVIEKLTFCITGRLVNKNSKQQSGFSSIEFSYFY